MQQILTGAAQVLLKQKPISASKTVQSANIGLLISAFLTVVPVVSGTAAQLFPDNAKDIAMAAGLITTVAGLFGYKASNDAKVGRIAVGDLYNGTPIQYQPPQQPPVYQPAPVAYQSPPQTTATPLDSYMVKQPTTAVEPIDPPSLLIDEPTEAVPLKYPAFNQVSVGGRR